MNQQFVSIHDDQYGQGQDLAFPTMSTCSCVIAVVGDRLVGVHKTMDRGADEVSVDTLWTGNHKKIFAGAAEMIVKAGGAQEIYVVGWNVKAVGGRHEVSLIRDRLNCQTVSTYVFDFTSYVTTNKWGNPQSVTRSAGKACKDVCTFAFYRAGQAPRIGLKRTTKVKTPQPNQGQQGGEGQSETIVTPSDHLHELKKFVDFGKLNG
jgi:hypothetical protein